ERGFIHEMELPVHGKVPMLGFAPRMSESTVEMKRPPRLGEHTDDVLAAELGFEEQQIDNLRRTGIIGDPKRFS
ncbi:MAG TPA: CoA transferase, partial [Pseudomonadales bacterium]|nr:CoA transferase [Pseudomonadales bacterium]